MKTGYSLRILALGRHVSPELAFTRPCFFLPAPLLSQVRYAQRKIPRYRFVLSASHPPPSFLVIRIRVKVLFKRFNPPAGHEHLSRIPLVILNRSDIQSTLALPIAAIDEATNPVNKR